MSLTSKAEADRMWAAFPVLRTLLESKRLPDRYYGHSSVSDNVFDRLKRILEISLLLRENAAEVSSALLAEGDQRRQLLEDVYQVREACQYAAGVFRDAADEAERIVAMRN